MYYLARLFSGQLAPGEPYTRIVKTIGISLCDFNLFPDLEGLHSTCRLYDAENQRLLTDILEIHFIELPKFRRDKPHGLRTPFEKWLHVLKFGELYESDGDAVPDSLKEEEGIEMALESMRRARASDEVREMIELRRKAEHDEATRLEAAVKKGRDEERQEMARRMLEAGFDSETIARITGLDPGDGRT